MAQTETVTGEGVTPATAGTGTRATRLIGIATIISMAWLVAFGLGFSGIIPAYVLALLKRGNRLSITPVSAAHWKFILDLAQ